MDAMRAEQVPQATRASRAIVMACGMFVAGVAFAQPAASNDPLEGRWLGTIGTPKERVSAGLEFRRNAAGTLELRLTQPILNTFDVVVPGAAVRRDGDTVTVDALNLALTIEDGRLVGHFPGPNSPATFERVAVLPREAAPPKRPEGPGPRWQARLGGQIYASPQVHGEVAYLGTTGGVMNAVDTRDGRIVWAHGAGCPIYGDAAVDDDAVYFTCDDGALHKLARADGSRRWSVVLDAGDTPRVLPHPNVFAWDWHSPKPLVADGVVYAGAGDGGFHAIDAETGERRWRFDTRRAIRNGAALDGDRVVVGSTDGYVYSLERARGRELWRFDSGAPIDATPVVHDGRVLVGNRGYGLQSLDAATGALAWKNYFWGSWVESTPVVLDGTIYIGSSDLRRVSAIDVASGAVRWRSDVFGWTWGTPLVDGEVIHVGAAGGAPYVIRHLASYSTLDRRTGRILTRRPLPDPGAHQWGIAGSPARAGDSILVATIEGSLYAYPRPEKGDGGN
ncbi:MAG TPA: PQQ-binding-like beta-propeller repeat protein [Xanthomonadales bacterium]|nr:PQQ-binding-like beta-propeller repeat protein [Xanthomonadales bacterium]